MGNCTCSKAEEVNESQYTSNDSEIEYELEETLGNISSTRRLSFDLTSDFHSLATRIFSLRRDSIDLTDYLDNFDNNSGIVTPTNISFERESIVSTLNQIYIEDEICTICAYNYDDDQHRPRILPCGHTLCYYCINKMARRSKFAYLECPLDRKCHTIKRHNTEIPPFIQQHLNIPSLTSESDDSNTLSSIDILPENTDRQGNVFSSFEDSPLDSASNEVSESSFLNTRFLSVSSKNDQLDSQSHVARQMSDIANLESQFYSVHSDSDIEINAHVNEENDSYTETEIQENENNDSDIETQENKDNESNNGSYFSPISTESLNGMPFIMQEQPNRFFSNSQVLSERHQENKQNSNVFCDCDECTKQKMYYQELDAETHTDVASKKEVPPDIYDDERSVRSFEWVDPDYSD